MVDTIKNFQRKQAEVVSVLSKLQLFINGGKEFGLNLDKKFETKLSSAINEVQDEKLRIALIGGFSEGKTSIAAAWIGKHDKSSMKISASESSNEVKVYDLGDNCILVDTPGLYGYKEQENTDSGEIEKYKNITKKYVSEAHIVLYVMNPKNPIKDSHRDDLQWLFKDLALLSRTVFVLGRFDEVADVEDEAEYEYHLEIKKENVKERLKTMLELSSKEVDALSIVGVSANPFDEGVDYWLKNPEEFKKLSHIGSLQKATFDIVENYGGNANLAQEASKTIFRDVLYKEMPLVEEMMKKVKEEFSKIDVLYTSQKYELEQLGVQIKNAKVNLRDSFNDFFNYILNQVKGTSRDTIVEFLQREIGDEGCVLNAKIQSIFEQETNVVSMELSSQIMDFNAEIDVIDSGLDMLAKKGVSYLVKNVKFNNATVLGARDGLVAAGKIIGFDLAKSLKFKPWGAIKLAKGLNGALAFLGIGLELWDSYKEQEKEAEFEKMKGKIIDSLQNQQKEILSLIASDDFIPKIFPMYVELCNKLEELDSLKMQQEDRQKNFFKWKAEGDLIEAEFREIN